MDYVKRSEWSADRNPSNLGTKVTSKSGGVVIHHTAAGGGPTRDHSKCDDRWRGHRNYHMDTRGWSFIAYSWLVCPHGVIYEGRGWENNGANAPVNDSTISICWEGTTGDPVDPKVIQAINEIIREAVNYYEFSAIVRGHNEVRTSPTSCPGELRAKIADGTIEYRASLLSESPSTPCDHDEIIALLALAQKKLEAIKNGT